MEQLTQDRLGRILVENNYISEEQFKQALAESDSSGKSIGRVLIDMGALTENQLTSVMAEQTGIRFIDLSTFHVDSQAVSLINENIARRYMLIPIGYDGGKLIVAMADPTNVFALDDIRIMTGLEITSVVSTKNNIINTIDRYMRTGAEEIEDEQVTDLDELEEGEGVKERTGEAPTVKYVNMIIGDAVKEGASDIHIEPGEEVVRIRYRVDGVLHEVRKSPKKIHPGIVSRIKILGDMNIAERRIPQDGRFAMLIDGSNIDLRVASIPTVLGEKIVLRVLDRSKILISLADLGLEREPLRIFSESFSKPYGTVIVTGPTGSGKTTTMYAALHELNRREVNVITVEDPVEYQMAGISQVQVHTKIGLSFARSLRSILRCDPDVLMIGEIRDPESAKIAIESALTGHMVLCTLHTNDAPSTMTRMIEMGVEPFLIASSVDSVVSQRLARRLCMNCREEIIYEREYLEEIGFSIGRRKKIKVFQAGQGGCPSCNHTGFRGRIGLFEVMKVDEDIEKIVVSVTTAHQIGKLAKKKGMKTLREDGFMKVENGITSIEEVLRVVM